MDRNSAQRQRELVYCHQCENEWYRDEHGLVCPECQSDFTEIIEDNNDPRDNDEVPAFQGAAPPGADRHEWYAPDPDEDDIDHFQHHNAGTGQHEGYYTNEQARGFTQGGIQARQHPGPGQGTGMFDLISTLFGGGQRQGQQGQDNQQGQRNQEEQHTGHWGQQNQQEQHVGHWGQLPQFHHNQQPDHEYVRSRATSPGGTTVVRHTSGPNFSMTFTTTSSSNLRPRDANSPQPFQQHPDPMEQLLGQLMMNIGAMQGQGHAGPGARAGQQGPTFMELGGGPRIFHGGFGGTGGFPFADLLSPLFARAGGVHGDAVHSQDAFDRIITQLMEQHQSGNAPGPASDDAINSLPSRAITKDDQGDSGKAECSICMDEAALGDKVTVLPCDHWFHHECIKAWLGEHDTCPHCRRGIMPKDEPNTNRPRQPSQAPLNDPHSPDHQIPRVPGEFPFSRQDSAGSSRPGPATRSPSGSGTSNILNRMREAFGGGGGGASGSGGSQSGGRQS